MSNFKEYGRICSDIETSYVGENNTALTKFSLAVDRVGRKNADGKKITDFHNCQVWGKKSELLEKYGKKGDRIVVEGTVENNNYEDKNGNKHYGYIINCSEIKFVETRKDREGDNGNQQTIPEPQETMHNRPSANTSSDDDFINIDESATGDLPFFG